jgi:hypothetical membrane protein
MNKTSHFFYYLSLFSIIQYILTTCILFYFYDGSSRYNLNHGSYLFFENFLSDLGRVVGFKGKPNVTAIFYATTLSIVGVGTFSFFFYIKEFFKDFKFSSYGFYTGVLSGICLALVGIFAVDENRTLHLTFLGLGYLLFFITFLGFNRLMFKHSIISNSTTILATILSFALLTYIFILIFGGDPKDSEMSLSIQVIAQKVIVYGQLTILALILFKLPPSKLSYISSK